MPKPTPPTSPTLPTLLSLPPELLHKILLHTLDTPILSSALTPRTLAQSDTAFLLSSTCTTFRTLFRTSIHSLEIPWNTPVYLDALASLFGPSLHTVSISFHSNAKIFFQELAQHKTLSLTSLSLSHCRLPCDPFARILDTAPPLKSLHLSFIDCSDIDSLLRSVAPHFHQLRFLSLGGANQLTQHALLAVCRAASSTLERLSLRYLRHDSITDETLAAIAESCLNLSHLFLDDVRHATPRGIVRICTAYAPQLKALRLYSSRLSGKEMVDLLTMCCRLEQLGLEEERWSITESQGVLINGVASCEGLRQLYLRGVKGVMDENLISMLSGMNRLESVSLRRAEGVTDIGLIYLVGIGEQLKSLDVRGCFISDFGLDCVGRKCPLLERVCLGGDDKDLTEWGVARVEEDGVSNHGVENLARACLELKEFVWETPRASVRGSLHPVRVGVGRLTGVGLVQALTKYCKNLERVEIHGLRPPARQRVQRAKFDLAVIDLEDAARCVVVEVIE